MQRGAAPAIVQRNGRIGRGWPFGGAFFLPVVIAKCPPGCVRLLSVSVGVVTGEELHARVAVLFPPEKHLRRCRRQGPSIGATPVMLPRRIYGWIVLTEKAHPLPHPPISLPPPFPPNSLAQTEENMARMQSGDELRLTLDPVGQRTYGKPWEGIGQVLRISDSEVSLMMVGGNVPLEVTDGYQVMTAWCY